MHGVKVNPIVFWFFVFYQKKKKKSISILNTWHRFLIIQKLCDALRDLVQIVQFKKHEKQLWKGDTFKKVKKNTMSTK